MTGYNVSRIIERVNQSSSPYKFQCIGNYGCVLISSGTNSRAPHSLAPSDRRQRLAQRQMGRRKLEQMGSLHDCTAVARAAVTTKQDFPKKIWGLPYKMDIKLPSRFPHIPFNG